MIDFEEEVQSTTRTGMLHLQKMSDAEFIQFIHNVGRTMQGQLQNLKVSLKVDGAGARFGVDPTGRPFFEGSRTGPIFEPGAFSAHAKGRGADIEQRAQHYENIFKIVINSSFIKTLPHDSKVICELFYNDMGEITPNGIKFVSVEYDPKRLGRLMTIIPFDVVVASTGEKHPDATNIKQSLLKQSTPDIKFLDVNLQTNAPIDISGYIDPIMSMGPETLMTLQDRRRDPGTVQAKAEIKQIIQQVKDEIADFILNHPNILDKFQLGPNIEGLVLNINGRDVKVTTPEFKQKKNAERVAHQAKKQSTNEDTGRPGAQPHPEDSVFDGEMQLDQMVNALMYAIQNPSSITIKWDGFPALVFGRLADGRFSVMDKYMFDDKKFATSPEEWKQYDDSKSSGKERTDLYPKLQTIWAGLEQSVSDQTGFFWGDLLWSTPLKPTGGMYVFTPNAVEYRVPVNSAIGRLINGRSAGIVVHQYFANDDAKPQPWTGKGLHPNKTVAILSPTAGINFKLNEPVQLVKALQRARAQYGSAAENFIAGLDSKTVGNIKQYANKKITRQTDDELVDWLNSNGHDSSKINANGVAAVFAIWNSIYALKTNLANQLEQQIQGMEQYVGQQRAGEGFVVNTPDGAVKLVNRGVFSAANFAHNP